jgi:hypothetical protein
MIKWELIGEKVVKIQLRGNHLFSLQLKILIGLGILCLIPLPVQKNQMLQLKLEQ